MRSYRQKIAVQRQHRPKREKPVLTAQASKTPYVATREYLMTAIRMYGEIYKTLEPLSDEWAMCSDILFRHKTDLEILERGSHEERKGVIEKYGR
jgi:hypothetical protein